MSMEQENEGRAVGAALFAFLAGAAAGAGLALLVAPKSGQEVRTKLREVAGDAMDKTRDYAKNMQEKVQERARCMMEKGKQKLQDVAPGVASAVEGVQEQMEERSHMS
ncbi:MAG TPA: YtxH domain-containing protein [Verrucomicrobiae bacterium]|nr:YtxH domain-containing protein [Verrucomicrobiae bacterium]